MHRFSGQNVEKIDKRMKKVGKTDVSVIMPIYNTEPYLREALDSLLKQTNPNIEIICVDDGSTDASASILKEYTEKDPRVQILRAKSSRRRSSTESGNGECARRISVVSGCR